MLQESARYNEEHIAFLKLTSDFDIVYEEKHRWKSKHRDVNEDLEYAQNTIAKQKLELSRLIESAPFDKQKLNFEQDPATSPPARSTN